MSTTTIDSPRARSRSPVKSTPTSPELHRKSSSSSLSSLHRTPSAADLKPNAHPYPIATTATGILSRANSLSSPSPNQTRHHYVPASPSSSRDESLRDTTDDSRAKERRAEYRGHRYSRSLSSSEDMYLPSSSSPSLSSGKGKNGNGNTEYTGAPSGPRALPVPPGVSANSIASRSAAKSGGSYSAYAVSPKRWTPAQLAAHLDRTVSAEAGAWAARSNVGGRAFMRMGEMGEEELMGMG
ncbi:hypothetical protein B0H19DRAFT_646363 [Mycena capillaripes]|nr:hypothetical protein B0H19DRAFT_646363 [Mycena capillaripes]